MAKSLMTHSGNGGPSHFSRDPFQSFREEMLGLMDRAFGRSVGLWDNPALGAMATMGASDAMPKIDIHETDKMITLTAELPGVDEKDVDLRIQDGVLTLKGEKRYEKMEGEGDARVIERSYGSFERSFTLPPGIDDAKIQAAYDKGILKVTLPKRPEAQASMRHIPIGKH